MSVHESSNFSVVTVYEQFPNPGPVYSVKERPQRGLSQTHLSLRNETMRELRDLLDRALKAEHAEEA